MKNHKLYEIWDKVPVTYYQKGTKSNMLQKIWHGIKVKQAREIISKGDFKNGLDVGCASGYMTSLLSQSFPQVNFSGIDVYDKAISFAKKNYPNISFKVAPAEKIPFKDNFFDLVVCYETIEHVEDPLKSLQEIRRVLRKDGVGIISMDSGNWLFRMVWFVWEKTKGKVWEGAHLHPFHHTQLGEMIIKSKLKIKEKIFTHLGMEVTFVVSK